MLDSIQETKELFFHVDLSGMCGCLKTLNQSLCELLPPQYMNNKERCLIDLAPWSPAESSAQAFNDMAQHA